MPPHRIAQKTREEMALLMAAGASPQEVAKTYKCHQSQAYKYKQNDLLFGNPMPPPPSVQGRPRKMTPEAREGLVDWLLENGKDTHLSYREEMRHFVEEEYGIEVSVNTIGRMLKEAKLSYKKVGFLFFHFLLLLHIIRTTNRVSQVERTASQRDEDVRDLYRARISEYDAQQLIFVDESASNERTADRQRGWSPRGVPCRVKTPCTRSKRWSILPAIGINGYLDFEIFHGSFNTERFNNFVRRLVTKMTSFPGPRSVLVMDNAVIHRSQVCIIFLVTFQRLLIFLGVERNMSRGRGSVRVVASVFAGF